MRPKRQHYVPKFYLRQFSNFKDNEYLLVAYNKESQRPFNVNIENIALENYFYSLDEEETIEKLFSSFEGDFNIALTKLLENEDIGHLNEKDKEVLAYFIAIQYLRTKEKRLQIGEIINTIVNIMGKNSDLKYQKDSVVISEKSLRNFHIDTIFNGFQKLAEIMTNKMKWKLCINNTDSPFWTSDNPCAIYNELEPEPFRGNLGFMCKGFQLHFPLSSKLLLILINPDMKVSDLKKARWINKEQLRIIEKASKIKDINVIDLIPDREYLSPDRIMFENNLQVVSSTQFIFSKIKNFNVADKYLNEYPNYKSNQRKRIVTNHDNL